MKDRNIYEIYKFYSGFISKSFPQKLKVSLHLQLKKNPFAPLQKGPVNSSDFLQQSHYAELKMIPVHSSSTSIKQDK